MGWYITNICITIVGCINAVRYPDGSKGCIVCNSSEFNTTPVDNRCHCTEGTLLGEVCNTVPGCTAANDKTTCISCNIVDSFQLDPDPQGQCFCDDFLEIKGTSCVDICGDGKVVKIVGAFCDDGNTVEGDGCSAECQE